MPSIPAFVLTLSLALVPPLVVAQGALSVDDAPRRDGPMVHVSEIGRYTLRANAISSDVLPPDIAKLHNIDRAADRGVLNVVILERRDERQVTVPAKVIARKNDLLGKSEEIAMRPIEENGRVSYLGTFSFAPLRNLRFTITAQPAGSEPLKVEFEDRFVVRSN